jgi:hypothetical protein
MEAATDLPWMKREAEDRRSAYLDLMARHGSDGVRLHLEGEARRELIIRLTSIQLYEDAKLDVA